MPQPPGDDVHWLASQEQDGRVDVAQVVQPEPRERIDLSTWALWRSMSFGSSCDGVSG